MERTTTLATIFTITPEHSTFEKQEVYRMTQATFAQIFFDRNFRMLYSRLRSINTTKKEKFFNVKKRRRNVARKVSPSFFTTFGNLPKKQRLIKKNRIHIKHMCAKEENPKNPRQICSRTVKTDISVRKKKENRPVLCNTHLSFRGC